MQDYRKPRQAMEARREKRRGRGRPRKTWEDCVIDVARRRGKTLADMKRLAWDRIACRKWNRTRRCKAIGIDKEESSTRRFKYDRDYLCVNNSQFVPIIFEPPCIIHSKKKNSLPCSLKFSEFGLAQVSDVAKASANTIADRLNEETISARKSTRMSRLLTTRWWC